MMFYLLFKIVPTAIVTAHTIRLVYIVTNPIRLEKKLSKYSRKSPAFRIYNSATSSNTQCAKDS